MHAYTILYTRIYTTRVCWTVSRYLKLDVVHWRGRHHAVEGGETVLVANLLAVQLKLRLPDLSVHVQGDHRLQRGRVCVCVRVCASMHVTKAL